MVAQHKKPGVTPKMPSPEALARAAQEVNRKKTQDAIEDLYRHAAMDFAKASVGEYMSRGYSRETVPMATIAALSREMAAELVEYIFLTTDEELIKRVKDEQRALGNDAGGDQVSGDGGPPSAAEAKDEGVH